MYLGRSKGKRNNELVAMKLIQRYSAPKLRGATLVEAMVGMVIIALIFCISVMIYTQVIHAEMQQEKLRSAVYLQNWLQESLHTEDYRSDVKTVGGIQYSKGLSSGGEASKQLGVLELKAENQSGKIILLRRQIVIVNEVD